MTKRRSKKTINRLARLFYLMQGCVVPDDYDFSKAKHPQEQEMWRLAEISFNFWKANWEG